MCSCLIDVTSIWAIYRVCIYGIKNEAVVSCIILHYVTSMVQAYRLNGFLKLCLLVLNKANWVHIRLSLHCRRQFPFTVKF